MMKEVSAGGIVSRLGKMLLVKVRNLAGEKVWTFPKGHLEKGETPLNAALREVEEETGWRCQSLGALLTVKYSFQRQGIPVAKMVKWYAMEPVKKTGKPDALEILAVKWVTQEQARDILSYPSDLKLLRRWTLRK